MSRKLTYEEVYKYFKQQGCLLLSNEYINSRTKLEYICTCGRRSTTRFSNFKKGHRCVGCGNEKIASIRRHSLEEVRSIFEDAGCKLLETDYQNNQQPLKFRCSCGRESKTSLANFSRGVRCYECGLERLRGSNNPRWNPDKRSQYRNTHEYRNWRLSVLKRDDYTCQKCGNLHWAITAHHIRNFKDNEGLRYDIDNGITLCRKCHTDFHVQYGYHDNDGEQFMEFFTEGRYVEPPFAGEVDDDAYFEYLESTQS